MPAANDHDNRKPVIFLAFANDHENFLHNLDQEYRKILLALDEVKTKGLCEVESRPGVTIGDIFDVFQKYRNRIAIFHYAGHADDYTLLLGSEDDKNAAAHSAGLVSFLAKEKGLQLVFINGCSSKHQAQELIKAGVPAVVGTAQPIDDAVATDLAERFYKGLAHGVTMNEAWAAAVSQVMAQIKTFNFRALHWKRKEETRLNFFPWDIYYRDGAEKVKDWNLPDAAENPLFGLPEISQEYYRKLPEQPFIGLEYFKRQHTAIFFGRGAQIRELYNYVTGIHPFILFYGESGVGKSSMLDAGLLPRLEHDYTVQYLRRDATKGLTATLTQALQAAGAATVEPAALLEAWCGVEAKTGHPLIIILDQAEESFTQPLKNNPESGRELEIFLEAIKGIFDHTGQRPQGKLILSYRKEYHPEIQTAFQKFSLPHAGMFLQQLDKKGIIEAVEGLTRSHHTQEKYHLEIEKGEQGDLAEIIATDLLADQKSAIAPLLQMMLTKLWQAAMQENPEALRFTWSLYQQLKRAGIAMDEFLKQQMEQLRQWNDEVVASGLALDVLYAHTTPLGTAGTCPQTELQRVYSHRQDILETLLVKFKGLYLLTEIQQNQSTYTKLAHDILAPVVIREYQNSDAPGQRAARVLSSKITDLKVGEKNIWLNAADLITVETGRKGMWQLTDLELKLLTVSQKHRRSKYMRVCALFLALASIGYWEVTQKAKVEELEEQRRIAQARYDNTQWIIEGGYFDAKRNPKGKGIDNKFELQKYDQVVYDATTRLYWQQYGFNDWLKYSEASDYIDYLNKVKFADFNDWRLPTLKEALSLMEPRRNENGLFIDPVFDTTQTWIWTADLSAGLVWSVSFDSGICYIYSPGAMLYVRAVRSGKASPN